MTLRENATLYVYAPDESTLVHGVTVHEGTPIPREGELLKTTDHTEDTPASIEFTHDEMLRVKEVQTEYRLQENIGRGQSWHQFVYVKTEKQE